MPDTNSPRTPTVQALIPGATYNSDYWDFPYDPETYSFTRKMNQAGYATFVIDRLGTGASSKPPSPMVTTTGQASAIHQAIQALRAGALGGTAYQKVMVGGHSVGALDAMLEASTYQDVDGVLITGMSHHLNAVGLAHFFGSMYPAFLDSQLAPRGQDPGYLTTRPGTRAGLYNNSNAVDPQVVARDEMVKDVFSVAEADNLYVATLPVTRSIQVPTFMAVGSRDVIACGPVTHRICHDAESFKAAELPYFSLSAHLQTYVLPGVGHGLNLAPNTEAYQQKVIQWADKWVGNSSIPR